MDVGTLVREAIRPHLADIARAIAAEIQSPSGAAEQPLHFDEPTAAKKLSISHGLLRRWREAGIVRAHTTAKPILYRREHIDAISRQMGGAKIDWAALQEDIISHG